MKLSEYREIYDSLNFPEDIRKVANEKKLNEELLTVIFTQKTVRETTKRFYLVKRNADILLESWKKGKSILSIARKWRFSPILTGLIIFQANGLSKKQYWNMVKQPELIKDSRLMNEIMDVIRADVVYSPWATEIQYKRGEWGENQLKQWLDAQGLEYKTERDLRGEFPKTPDCLLQRPIRLNGWKINWIESKASFGDLIEVKKNIRRQLSAYTELFGDGLVVYWFGYLEDIRCPDGIVISDSSIVSLNHEPK
ncbi:MAG: C15orf41 family protein [Methanomassiliicoccales archaeon]